MEANKKEAAAPKIQIKDVPALVQTCFGLRTKNIKQLISYDDKNFFIEVFPERENRYMQENLSRYVLKVFSSRSSKNEELLKGQIMMMKHLVSNGIFAPLPVKNVHGRYISQHIHDFHENCHNTEKIDSLNENIEENAVLLITFLPGKEMVELDYSEKLLYQIGKLVGRIYNALKSFSCEAIENRNYLWNLLNVSLLPQYLHAVSDPAKQNLIKSVLKSWEMQVVPLIPSLEKGIVHADLNERNILVTPDEKCPSEYKLGIVDFGDAVSSPYVFEVAIAITYALNTVENMDLVQTGGHLIAGYASERELSDDEWSILKECIAARFAQSLVLGAYYYMLDPNNEYLLETSKKGWERLEQFWNIPKDKLLAAWKNAIHRK